MLLTCSDLKRYHTGVFRAVGSWVKILNPNAFYSVLYSILQACYLCCIVVNRKLKAYTLSIAGVLVW